MHLIATYLPVLMLCAFKTSENVPSPFLLISLYSKTGGSSQNDYCCDLLCISEVFENYILPVFISFNYKYKLIHS